MTESEVPTATLEAVVEPVGTGTVTFDPPGGVYEVGTSVTISATPADGFLFEVFVDAAGIVVSTDPVYVQTIEDDATLIARFIPDEPDVFSLSVAVSPAEGGTVELTPTGGEYEAGTLVTLTAFPNTGYEFVRFSGDASSTNGTADLIMNADKTIVAQFTRKTVAVTVIIDPPGSGFVSLDPPGGAYEFGTNVTITATAAAGFVLDSFIDSQGAIVSTQVAYALVAEEDTTLTARFSAVAPPQFFSLTVDITPPGSGIVTLDPAGGTYHAGSVVTLSAAPSAGYAFAAYSGAISSNEQIVTITIDGEKIVTAEFVWSPALGNPGNLLVTGFVGNNVVEFDRFEGAWLGEVVTDGDGGLSFPGGIDVGLDGDIYVVSTGLISNTSILRYDGASGEFVHTFVAGVNFTGFFTLRFGPNGNLFVPDSNDDSVAEYDGATGEFVRTFVDPGAGGLDDPLGLVFGSSGNLFVASRSSNAVLEYDGASGAPVGTYADLAAVGFTVPVDLVFDQAGDMFVAVSGDDSVVRVDATSAEIVSFVTSESGGLSSPAGILFHPDSRNLLVVSQGTNEVLEYDGTTGEFLGVFATGAGDENLFFMAFRPK